MNIETKFNINDIVEVDGVEFRVWYIEIHLDDIECNAPYIEYTLIEPADSNHDDYLKLENDEINKATLVRPAADELARLGWN